MKIGTIYALVVLMGIVGAIYIPDPTQPNVFIPVILDTSRPNLRFQEVAVEDAPNPGRAFEVMYLIFAIPILLYALNNNKNGGSTSSSSNGGGGINVVTGSPCCG